MTNPKLSVIIPSYNESENLKKDVLRNVYNYLSRQDYSYEVLIVDDGSTDETVDIVKEKIKSFKNFKLLQNSHGGKAITVMTGLVKSHGDIALFTDMDQATPINQIEKMFPKFDEGFDIVIGSRHGREGAPILRKLAAWGFALLRNLILGLPFSDTQCGFKAFNRKSIEIIFPDLLKKWQSVHVKGAAVNAGFDVEVLFIAKEKGLKIAEVDVDWHYVGTERVQIIKDSLDAIGDMIRIRWNEIQGKYHK